MAAAINFPAGPALDQVFQAPTGVTYVWNGTLWRATGLDARLVPITPGAIIADVVLGSPAPVIELFNLGVRYVQAIFRLDVTSNGANVYMGCAAGNTVDTSLTYNTFITFSGGTPGGGASLPSNGGLGFTNQNGFLIGGGVLAGGGAGPSGHLSLPFVTGHGTTIFAYRSSADGNVFHNTATLFGPAETNIDGFFFSVTPGQFAAFSQVRVFGWP